MGRGGRGRRGSGRNGCRSAQIENWRAASCRLVHAQHSVLRYAVETAARTRAAAGAGVEDALPMLEISPTPDDDAQQAQAMPKRRASGRRSRPAAQHGRDVPVVSSMLNSASAGLRGPRPSGPRTASPCWGISVTVPFDIAVARTISPILAPSKPSGRETPRTLQVPPALAVSQHGPRPGLLSPVMHLRHPSLQSRLVRPILSGHSLTTKAVATSGLCRFGRSTEAPASSQPASPISAPLRRRA